MKKQLLLVSALFFKRLIYLLILIGVVFTILQWFSPYIDMNQPQVYMCPPILNPSATQLPPNPIPLGCPSSYIKFALVIYFTYGNIHVSMLFSHIIPPLPSPTESKSLFFISVSLLLSHIQGHHYHLSKFHIYVLIYCIGVFLSDLLHSV